MKTMPTSMFRLLIGQETPVYIWWYSHKRMRETKTEKESCFAFFQMNFVLLSVFSDQQRSPRSSFHTVARFLDALPVGSILSYLIFSLDNLEPILAATRQQEIILYKKIKGTVAFTCWAVVYCSKCRGHGNRVIVSTSWCREPFNGQSRTLELFDADRRQQRSLFTFVAHCLLFYCFRSPSPSDSLAARKFFSFFFFCSEKSDDRTNWMEEEDDDGDDEVILLPPSHCLH